MKSNNNKFVDVESQKISETDIPSTYTINGKLILSLISIGFVAVLSIMVFMFNYNNSTINSLQDEMHEMHSRAPLSADIGVFHQDDIFTDLPMQPYIQWKDNVSICILTDFEYDDIVLIGSLLMIAMEELSQDQLNPNLNTIINNLQIIYFAHNDPKKDGRGLWKKKLKMAEYFFPSSVYDKIVIRWKESNEPDDFKEWMSTEQVLSELKKVEYYKPATFVDNMNEKVDMIVIGPGHKNLDEINNLMNEKNKSINRFIMSVGSVNIREDQTSESDLITLFEWSQKSETQQFVDSSRFPWMGPGDLTGVHELGDKLEMERLLKQSNGYHVVMEYLNTFNLGMIYHASYPGVGNEKLCNSKLMQNEINMKIKQEIHELKEHLKENGFDHDIFTKLSVKIIEDEEINKYLNPDVKNITDSWRDKKNWDLKQMDKDKCWPMFKLKRILQFLNNEDQDGPAADPVIAFWHLFPNQHQLVHGRMIKDCKFTKDEVRNNGLFNTGLRMMVTNQHFDQIKGWKRNCKSRGEMVQIQLRQKYKERQEFLNHYQLQWQQMFQKFLDFRNIPDIIRDIIPDIIINDGIDNEPKKSKKNNRYKNMIKRGTIMHNGKKGKMSVQ